MITFLEAENMFNWYFNLSISGIYCSHLKTIFFNFKINKSKFEMFSVATHLSYVSYKTSSL